MHLKNDFPMFMLLSFQIIYLGHIHTVYNVLKSNLWLLSNNLTDLGQDNIYYTFYSCILRNYNVEILS